MSLVPLQSGTQISTLPSHTFDGLDNVFLDLHVLCTVMTKFHKYYTIPHTFSTGEGYGMAWHGVVWCGVVWCGMV